MSRLRTRSAAPWDGDSTPKLPPRRHTALPASLFLLLKGCTMAILRRLLLAAGRARAAGASARARLAKFERVLPPGRLKAAGRQYSPRKARTGCSGCCAGGRCAGRCCAGWRAVRPPAAAAPAPSLAGAVAPRAPNSAGTRHASSHSRGEQAVLCAKRARSRTFKAGSGHSKGIPLRIPSVPPS